MSTADETFRRLAIGDLGLIVAMADADRQPMPGFRLDDRTDALLRVSAMVALDAPQSSYHAAIAAAQRAGATDEDYLGVLTAIAGTVGSARIISAAPRIALAAGYDIDAALEANDPTDHVREATRAP